MCYDKKSSIIAGIIAYMFAAAIYTRNEGYDRWIAIFIFTYSTVQFLEAGVWYSIETNNNRINDFVTRLLLIALWLQPIVMTLGAIYLGQNNKLNMMLRITLMLLFVFMSRSLIRVLDSNRCFESKVGENGHLLWTEQNKDPNHFIDNYFPVTSKIIYIVGMFLPYMFMANSVRTFVMSGIVAVSLLYNYITYYHTGEFSSMWCYHAIAASVVSWFVK